MADQERYDGLPSENELDQLPRWALVAFAARCAERVRPLFRYFWPDAPQEHIDAVDAAGTLAWRTASQASVPAGSTDTVTHAANAETAGRLANADTAAAAAAAAAHAANAALAAYTAKGAGTEYAARASRAAAAAAAARAAARAADLAAVRAAVRAADIAMRRDYELLKTLAAREGWTGESPVDPDLLGPLWAEGEPEGWPESSAQKNRSSEAEFSQGSVARVVKIRRKDMDIPHVDFWIDPGDATSDDIAELFIALSDLQRALGGEGLVFNKAGGKDLVVRGVKR